MQVTRVRAVQDVSALDLRFIDGYARTHAGILTTMLAQGKLSDKDLTSALETAILKNVRSLLMSNPSALAGREQQAWFAYAFEQGALSPTEADLGRYGATRPVELVRDTETPLLEQLKRRLLNPKQYVFR